jgi:hypothetical protein
MYGVKALLRIWMKKARLGRPAVKQPRQTIPVRPVLLASTANSVPSEAAK